MEKQTSRVKVLLEFFRMPYRETSGEEVETTCWKCGKERHLYATEKNHVLVFSCKSCQAGGGEEAFLDGLIGSVVDAASPANEYWMARGIPVDVQETLGLKYSDQFERYAIPYRNGGGKYIQLALRSSVKDDEGPKYLRLPGVAGVPYILGDPESPNVVLTEGEVDAISAYVLLKDHPKDIQIVGLPGADFAKKRILGQFAGKNVISVVDNDRAGEKAARKIVAVLPGVTIVTIPPGFKDLNELLVSGASDAEDVLCDALNETAESKKDAGPITMAEFLKSPPKEGLWLVPELWAENAMGIVAGPPKVKKSLLTLHLAYAIAEGQQFLGRTISRYGPVLMVQEEDPQRVIYERLKQLSSKGSENLHLLIPSRTGWHVKMTDPEGMGRLEHYIQEIKPVLVTLDPLSNIYGGLSENDASEVSRLLDQLRHWRDRYHCSILIVHHSRKHYEGDSDRVVGYQLRGSSVFYAKVESLLVLSPASHVHTKIQSIQKAGESRTLMTEFHNGRFEVVEETLDAFKQKMDESMVGPVVLTTSLSKDGDDEGLEAQVETAIQ